MRILVTGGTGFIGSRVVRRLADRPGVETLVLARPESDLWRLHACGVALEGGPTSLTRLNLTDGHELQAVLYRWRPDVVIHLAAIVHHSHGTSSSTAMHEVNLHSAVRLHEAFLAAGGRRFVFAGSCFEYGHQDGELIRETTPCRPMYDYAVTKVRATEALLARAEAAAGEMLALRVFAPYGPLEDRKRIVPALLTAGLTGRRLELTPGGQVRDYIFVEDAARAFVTAALAPRLPRPRAIYNVCTAVGHSVRQLAQVVEQALGLPLPLEWGRLSYRPDEMMRLVGDNRGIADDLGWTPTQEMAGGLRTTAAWLRAALLADGGEIAA